MNNTEIFYRLKEAVLQKYRQHYPYYAGNIHDFGNKEIAQLLDLIEEECHERVSEKWVYTHLKPQQNQKLPRKDMLDIFSCWLGYAGWDEFVFENSKPEAEITVPKQEIKTKTNKRKVFAGIAALLVIIISIGIGFGMASDGKIILCLKDKYTQKHIEPNRVKVYLLNKRQKRKLKSKDSCYIVKSNNNQATIVLTSPYYKTDTLYVTMENNPQPYEYELQPDDYAMMLRAYMNGDTDDWQRRREQLNEILDDNAIIQEVMFDDIGVEFLNKNEFVNKITMPSKLVKNMEVVEIEYNNEKIISLKYIQK